MITADRLRELFIYDAIAGAFVRRVMMAPNAPAGGVAGSIDRHGYVQIAACGRRYAAHRLAWLYMTGEWPSALLDHRDGNKRNNSWSNLRLATKSQNAANSRSRNKTGLKGVSFDQRTGKWGASIRKDGRFQWLGTFATPDLAHAAYVAAAQTIHGEYARAA